MKEYHVIEFSDLIDIKGIEYDEYFENKKGKYYFEDYEDVCKDNWQVFDCLDG